MEEIFEEKPVENGQNDPETAEKEAEIAKNEEILAKNAYFEGIKAKQAEKDAAPKCQNNEKFLQNFLKNKE